MNIQNVICISSANRDDRRVVVSKNCSDAGLDFQFFDAIDCQYEMNGFSAGAVGCHLSHLKCLMMAKKNGWKNVLILEDDVEFSESFSQDIQPFLDMLPEDWGMVNFGGNHLDAYPEQVDGILHKCSSTRTTHAYLANSNIYDTLIDKLTLSLDEFLPVDEVYAELQREQIINCYAPIPPMAWQYMSHSDVEGDQSDYDFLKLWREKDYEIARKELGWDD